MRGNDIESPRHASLPTPGTEKKWRPPLGFVCADFRPQRCAYANVDSRLGFRSVVALFRHKNTIVARIQAGSRGMAAPFAFDCG
jgi:hypothetical protein